MDKDRIAGAAHQVKGAVKEALGKVTGDAKTQAEGAAEDCRESTERGGWRQGCRSRCGEEVISAPAESEGSYHRAPLRQRCRRKIWAGEFCFGCWVCPFR